MLKLLLLLIPFFAHAEAPVIWSGNGDYAQALPAGGFEQASGRLLRDCGSTDPSAGAGIAALEGSLCQYDAGVTGSLFVKSGAADTAWTNVLTSLTGWSLAGNAGTTAGTNFLGTTDAIDLVLKTDNTERFRIESGGNVGIGTTNPAYPFNFKAPSDNFGDGFALEGTGSGSNRTWEFFPAAAGFFYIRNPGASITPLLFDNAGRVGMQGATPVAAFNVKSEASLTSDPSFRIQAIASQSGDAFQYYNAAGDTKLCHIDVTGNISCANLSGTNTGDVTIGTANGLSLVGQALSLGLSSTSTTGALSDTDWDTFNSKQAAGNYITDLTGDVTAAGPGSVAATIAANAVTDGKFRQSAGLSVVGRSANSTGDVADITAASDNQIFRRSGTSIGFGSIDLSQSNTVGSSVLAVPNGGLGVATLTANGPVLGNGTSPVTQGTRSGNTTVFGTTSGSLVSGNCAEFDADGNIIDSGSPCGGGGGGGSFYAGAETAAVASCAWASASGGPSYTNFGADTDCGNPNLTGAGEAPATKVPAIKVTNWPAGTYMFVATGSFETSSTANCGYRFSDGTDSSAGQNTLVPSGTGRFPVVYGLITFSTTTTRTVNLQTNGTGTACVINVNFTSENIPFKIDVYEM